MFYDKIQINIWNIAVCQHTAHHIAKVLNGLLSHSDAMVFTTRNIHVVYAFD